MNRCSGGVSVHEIADAADATDTADQVPKRESSALQDLWREELRSAGSIRGIRSIRRIRDFMYGEATSSGSSRAE